QAKPAGAFSENRDIPFNPSYRAARLCEMLRGRFLPIGRSAYASVRARDTAACPERLRALRPAAHPLWWPAVPESLVVVPAARPVRLLFISHRVGYTPSSVLRRTPKLERFGGRNRDARERVARYSGSSQWRSVAGGTPSLLAKINRAAWDGAC